MNSGGRANEVGSAHRAAAAAYLAVHGIAGRPVHALGSNELTVTSLVLETEDPVDDLRCGLSDGRALVLQAKRKCGVDRDLRSALRQWVDQPLVEPTADGGERQVLVGVAAEEFTGRVRDLPAALNRRRQRVPGVASAPERDAVTAVMTELEATKDSSGEALTADRREHLLDTAYALLIDASRPSAPQRGEASAWLETLCAGSGHGDAAFGVLQHFFQGQASQGSGSTVEEWLTVLAQAGHSVADDPRGPIGQQRMAERRALRNYRTGLAAERDLLELSPLAGNLRPMRVPGLLASFHVDIGKADESPQREPFDLTTIARRWGRLVVTGLPGAGKSCALDQLTAAWAGDDDAPIPVRVRLCKIVAQVDRGADLTLDRLVESATDTSPQVDHKLLRPMLVDALQRGDAALLLDGLDECGAKAGVVADGISGLVKFLPTTSIVVTTRLSTSGVATTIGLPFVDLKTPSSLRSTLRHLVQHAAGPDHADDSAWVRKRQARIDRASALDRGLWSVPLLATLMTLQIVRGGSPASATSRARLMAEAVRESAERWLEQEHALTPTRRQLMQPEMVFEGFAIIAHSLAGGGVVQRSDAAAAVDEHLRSRWGKAPGEAEALAGAIVDFWDQHVGAFLVDDDEVVEPRAVHLVEIGDALWVTTEDAPERARWVDRAVHHENRREAVVLAAGLSPEVLSDLVEAAASGLPGAAARRRALEWAAEAAANHHGGATAGTCERLIDALAVEASAARVRPAADESTSDSRRRARQVRDGAGWWWVRHLASLPLPDGVRARRDERLAGQPLTDEQRVVADALRLLTDALVDDHAPLPSATVRACTALVRLELPDVGEQRVERASRRSAYVIPEGPHLLSGHVDAAALMAHRPEVLDDEAVAALHRIAPFAPFGMFDAITASLAAASLPTPPSPLKGWAEWARGRADGEQYRWFLNAAVSCGTSTELDRAARWGLEELAATAGFLRLAYANDRLGGAREPDSASVTLIVGALADAYGIDRERLAAQAHHVEATESDERRSLLYLVLAPQSPSTAARQLVNEVPTVLVEALLDLFDHPSTLVANAARDLLYATDDPAVGERLLARAPDMRAERRWWGALVGTLVADDPVDVAEKLLQSRDGPTRAGAVAAAVHLAKDDDDHAAEVVTRSRDDLDLTVRLAGGAPQDEALGAEHWSCPDCASRQPIDDLDCAECSTGARPGTHEKSMKAGEGAPG